MFEFDEIINRLIEVLNLKNKSELANLMEVSTQVMGNWKTRNKIPFEEIHTLCVNKNFDINYVLYGKKIEKNEKKINYKEEITKKLEELKEKELKYFYHLIEAEITKKEL
jgi:hypothetical protein